MTRLLTLLLLSLPAICQAQHVTVTRNIDGQDWSRTIKNADFAALEKAIEHDGQPGDRVHIVGTFTGGPLDMLDLNNIAGGELTGDGSDKSRLIFHAQYDLIGDKDKPTKPGGPALSFPNNGSMRIAGLYLENTPENVHEDGALGGWPGSSGSGNRAAVLIEDCEVKAHDWGLVYDWTLRNEREVTLRRVNGVASRIFVALMNSNCAYTLTMDDCHIGIDGNLSRSYGATSDSDPVTGGVLTPIILRAGTGKVTNCTFWVRGMTPPEKHPAKWVPARIVTVATDQFFSSGSKATRLACENCRVEFVEPAGETVVYDLDFRYGQATWDNSAALAQARGGSGPKGEIRAWGVK